MDRRQDGSESPQSLKIEEKGGICEPEERREKEENRGDLSSTWICQVQL